MYLSSDFRAYWLVVIVGNGFGTWRKLNKTERAVSGEVGVVGCWKAVWMIVGLERASLALARSERLTTSLDFDEIE